VKEEKGEEEEEEEEEEERLEEEELYYQQRRKREEVGDLFPFRYLLPIHLASDTAPEPAGRISFQKNPSIPPRRQSSSRGPCA